MKFLVDQQLPPTLVRWLVARGHEAEHVRNIGMRDSDDGEIWTRAAASKAIVLTKDEDFANRRGQAHEGPQIVWLRVGNTTTPALLHRLEGAWADVEAALASGAPIVEVR